MHLEVRKTELSNILLLRGLFLQEANTQISYNACHERGWSDSYLIMINTIPINYGSVKGQDLSDRDTIFEFYIIPSHRNLSEQLFQKLILASNVKFIECQSNDILLPSLIFEFAININSTVILFSDHAVTHLVVPDIVFKKRINKDSPFEHKGEPEGSHVIISNGEVIATGGFLLHYCMPFSDINMEVREDQRKKGIGSYLIQELKRESYVAGRVPAARCNIENQASKSCLIKAGFKVTGFMMSGIVK
jgi:hypothetical protein